MAMWMARQAAGGGPSVRVGRVVPYGGGYAVVPNQDYYGRARPQVVMPRPQIRSGLESDFIRGIGPSGALGR